MVLCKDLHSALRKCLLPMHGQEAQWPTLQRSARNAKPQVEARRVRDLNSRGAKPLAVFESLAVRPVASGYVRPSRVCPRQRRCSIRFCAVLSGPVGLSVWQFGGNRGTPSR